MPIISHATQQVTSSNERSIYNRRPKALFVHTDMLCKHLIEWCLIVDNMPLDVCKFNRSFSKKTYYSSFRQRLLNIAASLLLRIYYMPFAHWIRSFVTLTYRKLWSASECLASFVNATDARTDILNLLYSTFSNIRSRDENKTCVILESFVIKSIGSIF